MKYLSVNSAMMADISPQVRVGNCSSVTRFLASKDKSVILWTVDGYNAKFQKRIKFNTPICYLSWSPNDEMLLLTGWLLFIRTFFHTFRERGIRFLKYCVALSNWQRDTNRIQTRFRCLFYNMCLVPRYFLSHHTFDVASFDRTYFGPTSTSKLYRIT